jgi:hypothetical protein
MSETYHLGIKDTIRTSDRSWDPPQVFWHAKSRETSIYCTQTRLHGLDGLVVVVDSFTQHPPQLNHTHLPICQVVQLVSKEYPLAKQKPEGGEPPAGGRGLLRKIT